MSALDDLNPRQRAFVENYSATAHGTQSAIDAGYSKKTAHSLASRLLRNVKIKAALAELQEDTWAKLGQDREWMLSLLAEQAENAKEQWIDEPIYDSEGNQTGTRRVLYGKGNVANKSVELLARMGGHLIERHDVNVGGGLEIRITGVDPDDI